MPRRGFVPDRARFVPARAGFVTLRLLCIETIKTVDMLRPASRIVVLPQSRVLEERIAVVRCLLNSVRRYEALFAVATAFLLVETASFAANNNSVTYDITQGAGGSAVVNWTVLGGLNTSGVGSTLPTTTAMDSTDLSSTPAAFLMGPISQTVVSRLRLMEVNSLRIMA